MVLMKVKNDIEQASWNAAKAKELVQLSGFTRWKVAKEVGISEATLNNILNGQTPSLPVVKLLAQVLRCEESELLANGQEAS